MCLFPLNSPDYKLIGSVAPSRTEFVRHGHITEQFDTRIHGINNTKATKYFKSSKNLTCVDCGKSVSSISIIKYDTKHLQHKQLLFVCDIIEVKKQQVYNVLTIDHIIPRSMGGPNNEFNYQPMCAVCNSKKGNEFTPDTSRTDFYWYVAHINLILHIYEKKELRRRSVGSDDIVSLAKRVKTSLMENKKSFSNFNELTFHHAFAFSITEKFHSIPPRERVLRYS